MVRCLSVAPNREGWEGWEECEEWLCAVEEDAALNEGTVTLALAVPITWGGRAKISVTDLGAPCGASRGRTWNKFDSGDRTILGV
jgi:hypothetical protein